MGYAWHGHAGPKGEACPAKLEERRRADRWSPDPIAQNIVRETSLRMSYPVGYACGISDIVKRRLIRVWI